MSKTVEGIYRNGRVELLEPLDVEEEARVFVIAAPNSGAVDLASRGIGPEEAAALRRRLASFAEDWERAEMDVYDAV